jgi:hypothetical protein
VAPLRSAYPNPTKMLAAAVSPSIKHACCTTRSSSHSVAARGGCTNIPHSAGRAREGTVNLNNLEQFEGITLTSKPLKGRNPRRPETVTEHAKSVQVPMLSSGRRTRLDGLKLNALQLIALPTG